MSSDKPAEPLKLPDVRRTNHHTQTDIRKATDADGEDRESLESYLRESILNKFSDDPDYIRGHVEDLFEALGKEVSKEDIKNDAPWNILVKFNKSWSFNKVTDAHVRFYPPLKELQDRIKDFEEAVNRWASIRYERAEFVWRGTNEGELDSLIDGSWPTSTAGSHGDRNYRSVSINPYVARGYAESKYNSKYRVVLQMSKDIVGKHIKLSEYVCNAAGTAVKGNGANTGKRWADDLYLEEYFLLKDIDISGVRKDITVGVVNASDEEFEEFKRRYEGEFADIIRIPDAGEVEGWSSQW